LFPEQTCWSCRHHEVSPVVSLPTGPPQLADRDWKGGSPIRGPAGPLVKLSQEAAGLRGDRETQKAATRTKR
jgi:hypothetical protein